MSLPWFPFHIDKFLSDTLALDGEAIGAYVLLMLHYYATETPPRDNDRALATIARLPMDRWLDRRPEIAACFEIRDGVWHHPTIEDEIAKAKAKHAAGIASAQAGAAARWGKTQPKTAASMRKALPPASAELAAAMKSAQRNAGAMPAAMPQQSPVIAHLQEQNLSLSVLDVAGEKDNSGDNSAVEPDENNLGTPIDPQFWPCANHITVCRIDGADDETIKREVSAFVGTKLAQDALSHDWDATWTVWWKRWKDHRDAQAAKEAAKAKPRVEVSNKIDWDAHAKRWHGGMGWPRGVGPDPSSTACRCPPEILQAHAKEKV